MKMGLSIRMQGKWLGDLFSCRKYWVLFWHHYPSLPLLVPFLLIKSYILFPVTCIYVYIYIHTYMYTHTYIYITYLHIHTYTEAFKSRDRMWERMCPLSFPRYSILFSISVDVLGTPHVPFPTFLQYIHLRVRAKLRGRVHAYQVHIHIHTCTHAHAHKHTHMCDVRANTHSSLAYFLHVRGIFIFPCLAYFFPAKF